MEKELKKLREAAKIEIARIKAKEEDLELIRVKYLGRKGLVTKILRVMKQLSPQERKIIGKLANEIKEEINLLLNLKQEELKKLIYKKDLKEDLDITLPGKPLVRGKLHPLTRILEEIKVIFEKLNFDIVEGPEVETEYYNFEALNTPEDHPARDMQATFYISDGIVLRTQTSPVQIRVMEKTTPPLRIIAPGRCYRSDAIDASHSPVFHQVEGLVVGKEITFRHLKSIMKIFFRQLFGEDIEIRLTPSFFPFTEPSAEVSVCCVLCKGKGCSVCQQTGWLELFGAGMVDPNVFKAVGYDPEEWTGFAFGGGIERLAMIKYGISDIRLFYENDLRFLKQF